MADNPIQNAASQVKDKAQDAASQAKDQIGQVKDKAQDAASQLKDKAQDAASQVKDKAQPYIEQAQQAVQPLKEQVDQQAHTVKETAQAAVQQGKEQAQQAVQQGQTIATQALKAGQSQFHTLLTNQKNKAAAAVTDIASVLRTSGAQLKEQGQAGGAQVAERAADRIGAIGDAIQQKEVEELVADTEAFARQRPVLFLTIAALLGVLLVRFLKSSGQAAA